MALSNKAAGRLALGSISLMATGVAYVLHGAGYDVPAWAIVYVMAVTAMVVGLMRLDRARATGREG